MVNNLSGNPVVRKGAIGKECVRYSLGKKDLKGLFGAL